MTIGVCGCVVRRGLVGEGGKVGRAQWKLECRKSSNPPAGNVPPDSIISAPEKRGETSVGPFFKNGALCRSRLSIHVIGGRLSDL